MKKLISFIMLMQIVVIKAIAQSSRGEVAMADVMRSNGKIYVVIAVLLTIFAALICFIIMQELRLKRIEKKLNEHIKNQNKQQ